MAGRRGGRCGAGRISRHAPARRARRGQWRADRLGRHRGRRSPAWLSAVPSPGARRRRHPARQRRRPRQRALGGLRRDRGRVRDVCGRAPVAERRGRGAGRRAVRVFHARLDLRDRRGSLRAQQPPAGSARDDAGRRRPPSVDPARWNRVRAARARYRQPPHVDLRQRADRRVAALHRLAGRPAAACDSSGGGGRRDPRPAALRVSAPGRGGPRDGVLGGHGQPRRVRTPREPRRVRDVPAREHPRGRSDERCRSRARVRTRRRDAGPVARRAAGARRRRRRTRRSAPARARRRVPDRAGRLSDRLQCAVESAVGCAAPVRGPGPLLADAQPDRVRAGRNRIRDGISVVAARPRGRHRFGNDRRGRRCRSRCTSTGRRWTRAGCAGSTATDARCWPRRPLAR